MSIASRRRALMGAGKKSRLPAEYQEVGWIGSSGTQYIATGVELGDAVLKSGTLIKAKLSIPSAQSQSRQALFGFSNTVGYCILRAANSNKIGPNGKIEVPTDTMIDVIARWDTNALTLYYEQTTDSGSYITVPYYRRLEIMRFGYLHGSTTSLVRATMKIATFTVENDNNIIFNGVPCYRKADDVIGIYDLVSNTFLTNAGTGTFTKGGNV